jgi:SulP family sulfate permease
MNNKHPQVRIIRMRKVPFMDSTGLHNLESLYRLSEKENVQLILSGVNEKITLLLERSGFADKIGKENILSNINEALERSKELTEKNGEN